MPIMGGGICCNFSATNKKGPLVVLIRQGAGKGGCGQGVIEDLL